jgi:very-short-patch-repair endonuclease
VAERSGVTDYLTRGELLASGLTSRGITAAVRAGELIRARCDRYVPPTTADAVVRAVRVGGRLTCLSLLQLWGVFVLSSDALHVHVAPNAGRLRSPHDRRRRLEHRSRRGVHLHWTPLHDPPGQGTTVGVIDALVHAVRCQAPRAAVATLDSAVRVGIVLAQELDEVFDVLPSRYRVLRSLMDPRVESGPESLVGLMLRTVGCRYEPQVVVPGVGRVDFVVEGWLVIECDSEAHHGDAAAYERDRYRDAIVAALGFVPLRLTARVIMYQPDVALAAIRGLLAHHSLAQR